MGIALPIRIAALCDRVGAIFEHRAVQSLQTDQLPTIWIVHEAALLRAFAEEIIFLLGNRPTQPQVLWDHSAVGFIANHDKALLSPHDVQTFRAIGHCAKLGARLHEHFPERQALIGRHSDFIRQLARERDAISAAVDPANRAIGPSHKGQALRRNIHAAQFFQKFPSIGADNCNLSQLLGHIDDPNLPIPPFGLQPFFHMGVNAICAARGGVAQPGLLINPCHHTIIGQKAIFRAHEPIAAASRL